MKRACLAALLALASAPSHAAPGGQLRVLIQGPWTCELPGDATVVPTPRTEENFRATPDSSYSVDGQGEGNYLLLGDRLTMTSGPFTGRRYEVANEGMVRRLDDAGKRTGVRCVRAGTPAAQGFESPAQ